MNIRKFSINKACILLGILLLLAVGVVSAAIYLLTENITAVGYVFLFSVFVLLCVICFVTLIRRKLVMFSDSFCGQMVICSPGILCSRSRRLRKKAYFIKSTTDWGGCTKSCRKIKTTSQRNGLTCKS